MQKAESLEGRGVQSPRGRSEKKILLNRGQGYQSFKFALQLRISSYHV